MAQPQVEKAVRIDPQKDEVSEFVESLPKKKPAYAVIDLLETVTINSKDFGPKEKFVRFTEDELWERLRDGYEARRSASQLSSRKMARHNSEGANPRPGKSARGPRMRSKSVDASFDSHFNQGALLGNFDNSQLAISGLSTSFVRPKLMKSKGFCVNPESPDQQHTQQSAKEDKLFLNFNNACAAPPKQKLLQRRSRSYNDFKTLKDSFQKEGAEPLALLSGAQVCKMPYVYESSKHQNTRPIRSDSDAESVKLSRIEYPADDFPDVSKQKELMTKSTYGARGRHKHDQSVVYDGTEITHTHRLGSSASEDDVQLPKLSSSSKVAIGPFEPVSDTFDYNGSRDFPKGIISSKSKTQQTNKPKKRVTLYVPEDDSVFLPENYPRNTRQTRSAHAKLPEVDQPPGKGGLFDRLLNDSGIDTEMDNCAEAEEVCNLSDENEAKEVLKANGRHSVKEGSQNRIMDWLSGLDESSQQYMRKQMAVLPEIEVNED